MSRRTFMWCVLWRDSVIDGESDLHQDYSVVELGCNFKACIYRKCTVVFMNNGLDYLKQVFMTFPRCTSLRSGIWLFPRRFSRDCSLVLSLCVLAIPGCSGCQQTSLPVSQSPVDSSPTTTSVDAPTSPPVESNGKAEPENEQTITTTAKGTDSESERTLAPDAPPLTPGDLASGGASPT